MENKNNGISMEKNILVPIDFSENAFDAALYASGLALEMGVRGIVLYHSDTAASNSRISESADEIVKGMESIQQRLNDQTNLEITCLTDRNELTDGINRIVVSYNVDLVVMGITGRNRLGQRIIGSNVFRVSERAAVPVLIVPSGCKFQKIEHIALAVPIIADLGARIPRETIKQFIDRLGAKLMILNVGMPRDKTPKSILYSALSDLFELFDDDEPSYHFPTATGSTANAISTFASDNHAQLLICISGEQRAFQNLFSRSMTERLGYSSKVPLLIFKSLEA